MRSSTKLEAFAARWLPDTAQMSEPVPSVTELPQSRADRRAFTRSRSNDDIYTYDSRLKPAENPIELPEKPSGEVRAKPLEKIEKLQRDERPENPFEKLVDNAEFMKKYIKPSGPMSMSAVRAMLDDRNRRKYRSLSV